MMCVCVSIKIINKVFIHYYAGNLVENIHYTHRKKKYIYIRYGKEGGKGDEVQYFELGDRWAETTKSVCMYNTVVNMIDACQLQLSQLS